MTTALEHATWAYNQADSLSGKYWYTFGGGHPRPYLPWVKINPKTGLIESSAGPDCSGWACNILWHAGLLENREALNTEWFESWGEEGKGKYVTLRVLDENRPGGIHHCFLEFTIPNKPHRYSVAAHEGTLAGWADNLGSSWVDGYKARHSKTPS